MFPIMSIKSDKLTLSLWFNEVSNELMDYWASFIVHKEKTTSIQTSLNEVNCGVKYSRYRMLGKRYT